MKLNHIILEKDIVTNKINMNDNKFQKFSSFDEIKKCGVGNNVSKEVAEKHYAMVKEFINYLNKHKMKKGYSANFKTSGNWLIPFILGWSESIVSVGSQPIGIMFTLHITPYINIGFNNPHPKIKPTACDCGCMGPCECDDDFHNDIPDEIDFPNKEACEMANEFVFNSNKSEVFGAYPVVDEEKTVFIVLVANMSVIVPDNFAGVPTKKEVTTDFEMFETI